MEQLIGREDDLAIVERFIVGAGPGALLLEGPPGIGKTSLFGSGIELARRKGLRVLVASPSSDDASCAYAGLADVFAEVGPSLFVTLPEPQREALESALLLRSDRENIEPRAVALAVLSVLRCLGDNGATLVGVDDLPWLDEPSASALGFAARRLDTVRFLLASRPGEPSSLRRALRRSLEHVTLGPLDAAETRHLLYERLGLALPRRSAQRVFAASQGNPLFAIELGRSLQSSRPPEIDGELPLPATVEEILGDRVGALSEPVRHLLLAAALGPQVPASQLPGIEALREAIECGVVSVDGERLRPSHPLLGVVAVSRCGPGERRLLHLELASAAAEEEQRSVHLALATELPDGALAERVAAAAALASARGATMNAAELGEHAVRLTPSGAPERGERCLSATRYLCVAGELARARAVLGPELTRLAGGEPVARGYLLAHEVDLPCPAGVERSARHYWTELALEASREAPALHAEVVTIWSLGVLFAGACRVGEIEAALRQNEAAARRNGPGAELRLLFGLSWATAMRGLPLARLLERAGAIDSIRPATHHSVERAAAVQLMWRGRLDEARARFVQLMSLADDRGEAESYFVHRLHLCEVEVRAGRLDAVAALLEEWSEEADGPVAAPAAMARFRASLAAVSGVPGKAGTGAGAVREALELCEASGDRWQYLESLRASGIAKLLAGDAVGAATDLQLVLDHATREGIEEPGLFPVAPDLVEALALLRRHDEARVVVSALSRAASELDHPWARITEARCRALLRPAAAESPAVLEQAAADYRALGLHLDRARTLLVLGAALSSKRRLDESIAALGTAAAAFDELGAFGWAERARAELGRAERERGGRCCPLGEPLTPAEEKVARLVAIGHRNREVAAQLFISEKTVEAHLSRIYTKLKVRSRTELAHRFGGTGRETASWYAETRR